jgi:hypothetical protein
VRLVLIIQMVITEVTQFLMPQVLAHLRAVLSLLAVAVVAVVMVLRLEELAENLVVLVEVGLQVQLQDKNLAVQELLDKEIVVAIVRQVHHLSPALAAAVPVRRV